MTDEVKVGIAGLGTVGVGVIKILNQNADLIKKRCGKNIIVSAVSARDKSKDRGVNLDGIKWYDNSVDIANSDVDIVIEVIGGEAGDALQLCENALNNGKHVVTANKALIAKNGNDLAKIAQSKDVHIAFEAAVAGGIPIIKSLKEGMVANNISVVMGIMNGTCNYILTQMKETGRDFEDVLKEAQDLGYAEADPTFDVDGIDTAHKLAILTSLAYGVKLDFDSIYIEGIRKIALSDIKYAGELGYKIKLLGISKKINGQIQQAVYPCLLPDTASMAKVDGVNNAVLLRGDFVGDVVLEGPGAGEGATASAVVADIVDIVAERFSYPLNVKAEDMDSIESVSIDSHIGKFYIRLNVKDQSGVLAKITDILGEYDISVDTVLQKANKSDNTAHVVIVTHEQKESDIVRAVKEIVQLENVVNSSCLIRIEE
ncbi:homoserine dehydrogenase [Rickettsiales bacterium]|nr:homoserine dehydrogenase [Rickettsiales bacterium]